LRRKSCYRSEHTCAGQRVKRQSGEKSVRGEVRRPVMKETSGQLKEYIEDPRSRNMRGEVRSQIVYIRNQVKKQRPG
jgi:hypothetical protein